MSAQMTRLLQILLLLPRYPRFLTIEQIHRKLSNEGMEFTVRTVQRDMNVVEAAFKGRIGVETYDDFCRRANHYSAGDSDRSNHWFWTEEAPSIHLSGLTINQALTLRLLDEYLAPLLLLNRLFGLMLVRRQIEKLVPVKLILLREVTKYESSD